MAALLGRQIADLDSKINEIDAKLTAMHKPNEVSQRLATIQGVGLITALTLALAVDPSIRKRWNRAVTSLRGPA